ncbi:methionine--tRNA ligase [Candidatus Micrarchaeota archaeon]|nr:methionine--tRNA ligase [Candidatus Micrarchaeota archaeon]MBD3418224.1 methionine--tRNA ligase [Candidatus Micrarchaeota archaeon]
MEGKFYTTTAIPYVNAAPHLGHALEFVQTDVIARYQRLRGKDVALVTGADENSLKNVQAAEKRGISVEQLCEENAAKFREMADAVGLSYTSFQRTSGKEKHWAGVQKLWELCSQNGDLYKKKYRGLYCVGCEAFLEESELVDGMCPEHKKAPEPVEEENYFFRLSKYQEKLEQLIESNELKVVPETRKNEVLSFIRGGLKDFSISRSVERAHGWGVPVPGDSEQIMYVWFDALGTYLTGIGYGADEAEFGKYWPADVHVIGKGILRFHAVYWPVMLLSAGLPLPKNIFVHGYITVEGQKMSKSLGNIVDPFALVEKFGVEPVRYCLLSEVPTFEDGDFSERVLVEKNNNELIANIGNLVNRTMVFIRNNFEGRVPRGELNAEDEKFLAGQKEVIGKIGAAMDEMKIREALQHVMEFGKNANKYFQDNAPWELVKSDKGRAGAVLYLLANQAKDLGILCAPFLPGTSASIFKQLGLESRGWEDLGSLSVKEGHGLGEPEILFRKIEGKKEQQGPAPASDQEAKPAEKPLEKPIGDKEKISFAGLDLEVGEIVSVEKHPDADKLYVEKVRLGDGEKQVVSGLVEYISAEELKGKRVVIVKNLAPAKLRGVESEGMLLVAESREDGVEVLEPDAEVGEKITMVGVAHSPKEEISFKEFSKVKFKVRDWKVSAEGKQLFSGNKLLKTKRVSDGKVS